jgi:hypothetical protein
MRSHSHLYCIAENLCFFHVQLTNALFFGVGSSDTPIERSHKKKCFLKKRKTIDALVQKIQLDEHGKFRYDVIFAAMDMLISEHSNLLCHNIVLV